MQYAQLNEALDEALQITSEGNIAWDENNFCTAAALIADGKAAQFRVVALYEVEPPAINASTQTTIRDGCEFAGGRWQYKWRVDNLSAAQVTAKLQVARTAALIKIDADADKIYGDVVGNKSEEYRSAEADAKAFIAANYTGTAGSGVTSWATAKGWTTTQAANDIIAQATAWRGAQALIRAQRLGKKEAVKAAGDLAVLNTAMAQWTGFVTAIRGQLGV
jgi:hypothetical protein